MGHGLTLSGIANFGHDVGGFAGPKPEPELFVRWVEQGIFWPRFSIHSWNDDATANEPWMYPEVLPAIRASLTLRERLVPYLYTVLYRVHADYAPALSPLFLAYPDDPGAYAEDDSFLLGDALLVAPVVEPGVTERRVRLPDHPGGWYDFWTGAAVAGGGTVTAAAPLGRAPVFVAAGTILPLGPERSEETGDLVLRVYPGPDGARLFLYDDDGDSVPAPEGIALITAAVDRDDRFTAARRGGWPPRWPRLGFERPDGSPLAVVIGDRRVTTIPTEALPSAPLDRVPLSVVDGAPASCGASADGRRNGEGRGGRASRGGDRGAGVFGRRRPAPRCSGEQVGVQLLHRRQRLEDFLEVLADGMGGGVGVMGVDGVHDGGRVSGSGRVR
jgi:hypothetical protein